MQHLRSGAGVVAVTAGALAVLSFPVIAAGKGPPEPVGGGTDTALGVVPPQAHVPDSPPGQPKRPDAAPTPAPPAQDKAPARLSPPAPDSTRAEVTAPANVRNGAGPISHGPKSAGPASAANDGVKQAGGGGDRTLSDAPKKASATTGVELPSADARHATDDGDLGGAGTTETAELPEDASAATLPFTGFQLALMALIGSAVMAAGLTLRRTAAR